MNNKWWCFVLKKFIGSRLCRGARLLGIPTLETSARIVFYTILINNLLFENRKKMIIKVFTWSCIIFFAVASQGCKLPYDPPAIASPGSYLVVEGMINSGSDSTFIKLSRTVNLSSVKTSNPELGSQVVVEGDDNSKYVLMDIGKGNYATPPLSLNKTHKYRLRITTANNEQYLSAYEAVLNNPPIDSVGFTIPDNNTVRIYVNTHDPANVVNYYRWDYAETWKFHSEYQSGYITNGKAIVPRTPDQDVYHCFARDSSSTIILGSSAQLTQSVIYQKTIAPVLANTEKLEEKYSIEVNQYALSKDAYNFWVNLKKNTEQLGSIFDAQPSTINGNIQCLSDPSKPVIGFISVSNVQRKRVFIAREQLPITLNYTVYPYDCKLDSILFKRQSPQGGAAVDEVAAFLVPIGSQLIPVNPSSSKGTLTGYLASSQECVVCTLRGTKKQPAFWR